MTSFNDKERAQESKYALDKEKEFKVVARRNKLLGAWAAGILKLEGEKAAEYAKSVVMADFEEAGDEDVFRKVQSDLKAAGASTSDEQIRQKMTELMTEAHQQIDSE